jgi:hypothetical protein
MLGVMRGTQRPGWTSSPRFAQSGCRRLHRRHRVVRDARVGGQPRGGAGTCLGPGEPGQRPSGPGQRHVRHGCRPECLPDFDRSLGILTWASPTALEMRKPTLCPAGGWLKREALYCEPAMFFSLPAGPLDSEVFPEKPRIYCRTRLDVVVPAPTIVWKKLLRILRRRSEERA